MRESTKFNGKRNKGGKLPQNCDRKEIRKNSRLRGREFICFYYYVT